MRKTGHRWRSASPWPSWRCGLPPRRRRSDQSSDQAALTAYHSYLAGGRRRAFPTARKADAAYVSSVSGRCPNVLASLKQAPAGSVNQTALFDFGEELGGDAGVVAYGPGSRGAREDGR